MAKITRRTNKSSSVNIKIPNSNPNDSSGMIKKANTKNKKIALVSSDEPNKLNKINKILVNSFKDDAGNVDYDALDSFLNRNLENIKQIKESFDERKLILAIKELYPAYFGELLELLSLSKSTLHDKIEVLRIKKIIDYLSLTNSDVIYKREVLKKITGQISRQFYIIDKEFEKNEYAPFIVPVPKQFRDILSKKKKEFIDAEKIYKQELRTKALILKEKELKRKPIIIKIKEILSKEYVGNFINFKNIKNICGFQLFKEISDKKARYYLELLISDVNSVIIETEQGLMVKSKLNSDNNLTKEERSILKAKPVEDVKND